MYKNRRKNCSHTTFKRTRSRKGSALVHNHSVQKILRREMLESNNEMHTPLIQRSPRSPFSMEEGRIIEGEETVAQAKAEQQSSPTSSTSQSSAVESVLNKSGKPLTEGLKSRMEQRFNYDFSDVRVHWGSEANQAALSINAKAFTAAKDIVFAQGQYQPETKAGEWLLAHELTHVVQQNGAKKQTGHSEQDPEISDVDSSNTLRRVRWNTAVDTGTDSQPWGSGPKGDVYKVETDAGNKIPAWKPHDGSTYWCHGYTFGGASASGGPFSIWGSQVPQVLADDGWQHQPDSCVAQASEVLVFADNNVAHSGIVHSTSFKPNGDINEAGSMLDSKWGQLSLNRRSWERNANQYGKYQVFSKNPVQIGDCENKGENER